MEKQKCQCCKVEHSVDNFKRKRNGDIMKSCKQCLEKKKLYRSESKCEHGKERCKCIFCGGSQMCEHLRRRCECKDCNNPIPITIKNIIRGSKNSDKQNNRYDQVNFIDYCFVENLIDDCNNKCFYCDCDLQYVNYTDNLATIERLVNSVGHIKGNCVIACKKCNISKVGNIE